MTQKMHTDEKQIKYQFLSMLSHELKSPINAVEGYLRILSEKQVGEKVDDYMEMIDRSLIRLKGMRHLIGDLLDLTKIESGEKSREIKNTDIIEIARYARDTMEALAATKHVKIFLDAPDTLYLEVDRQEIEIIFNNLLSNAIKYNKESGSVNFTIKENSSNVQIIVEDTGVGMSKEDRAKLFQEFVRLQNVNTRGTTGTGLGLSIVKKIVEMNYGTIEVSSIPNEGSTFTILLPGKAVKNS
ncbi:MAG: HAMP domain-containing histidine kinase [Bacteroidetes bacterium]|nr:HAMP domain-containing histidine kinase [Bacteroidota bacterium]